MLKANLLKKLVDQLSGILPNHLGVFKKDFEENCHRVLTQAFTKLDLVTREEFDVQTKVLARTRQKVEELEKLLQLYEIKFNQKKNTE